MGHTTEMKKTFSLWLDILQQLVKSGSSGPRACGRQIAMNYNKCMAVKRVYIHHHFAFCSISSCNLCCL